MYSKFVMVFVFTCFVYFYSKCFLNIANVIEYLKFQPQDVVLTCNRDSEQMGKFVCS